MELSITRIATAALIGYAAGRAASKASAYIAQTLQSIDDAIAAIDFDDVAEETCEANVGHIHEIAGAVLHNGTWGLMPLAAEFCWRVDDPHAVAVAFSLYVELPSGELAADSSTWEFARDLLDSALHRDDKALVGEGDVKVQFLPESDVLVLYLTDAQHDVDVRIDIDAYPVRNFVASSYQVADEDGESSYIDAAITRLLDGTWKQ